MNYNGNMPDWHQYNPPQSGISDVTPTAQNVNSGHLPFISSINSSCPTQLNNPNLNPDGLEKHQSDLQNFNPRHFQHLSANISHGHNVTDNTPLASMVQMQNCIGHYGPSNTRNPMVDNLNAPMDPRNTAISGLNEELNYRNNQVPLHSNGPMSHLNGPNVMNMNASHRSIGSRNTNVNPNSHAANRTGLPSSFPPCKAPCCNPDPNYQQWEKYCSYQNNMTYRENIRTNGYQVDARRFGGDFNFRKDNFDGKEILPPSMVPNAPPNASDHRRNFPDFKYRKERAVTRNYPSNSGMLQSYPMQNYSYTSDYQKYSYPNIKEYPKMSNMNVPNQGMIKHQDQNFYQQKYNNKSMPYQSNGTMISTANHIPNSNMISSTQNTYFNSQYSRNLSTDTSHDCQHADNCQVANDNATTMMNARIQTSSMHASSHVQYQQVYQQKIAMQRFSMENHLREMTKIPGYQSHPKYKECILRYREILKLQQSVAYHGQIPSQQTSSCVSATTINTAVPPINLQFDQNGILINSNYVPDGFPRIQVLNSQTSDNLVDKQNKQEGGNASEMMNHNIRKPEQLVSQQHDNQTTVLCLKSMEQQDRYSSQKNLDQSQFEVQKTGNENFNDLNTNASDASVQQKISKEFADKPELDVRQFLANWDESEDEDGTNTNAILNDSTSVVVVGYENVNFSTKTLETLEGSKSEEITTNVIAFENPDKSNTGMMPAQDCLTISYASAENVEITKDSTSKEITKENIVQPGSHIIQCISNGPDEVPTIHIVDNLEIGSILQVTNGQITQTLGRQDAVSFFQDNTKVQTSTVTIETDKKTDSNNESAIKCNAHLEDLNKEKYIVENSSPEMEGKISQISQKGDNHQEITTLPTSIKNNLDSSQDMNLKKQNSFTSEESHNPDDISLPDLPTSECTPISTTLNTPIHSDNEESSERGQDLTISTNPIEIIQNSPIISFTQSPMKNEPYDHLNNEREAIKNKSIDSLENQYQTENRFKDQNNDILERDVLGTFEFSTNISKNESIVENDIKRSLSEDIASNIDNSRTFLNSETEKVGTTGVCMTLTSGEYELKIMSAQNVGISNKSVREYNSSIEHCESESQTVATVADQNASTTDKKLQILAETNTKNTCNNSTQLDETLQNITNKSDEHHDGQDNIHYEKKCILTDFDHETTANTNTINLSTNDIASISSKTMIEDNCSTKDVKNDSSISLSTKHPISNSDELQKYETSDNSEKDPSLKKNTTDNKPLNIDTTDSKNSWHIKITDQKKSILNDQTNPHSKKSSESTTEKYNEMIMQHDKHAQDVAIYKDKSCAMENLTKSNILCKKPRIIDNISIDDSGERMRFLKEYRRIKHKSSNEGETQTKNKHMLEACDFATGKICHFSSNSDEQSKLQILNNKQLCQKNAGFKLAEEQEKEHANILKTFVTKNVNPDFAIQVTNVNFKDNKEEKESKHLEEETKNSGSLDAIKIEINVSCTERNTTEKLLHENIKNAVAETIGHLTNSISSGARSNSTNLMEFQCDKRMTCDKDGLDYPAYEKHNQSSSLTEASTYKELCKNQSNIEIVKYESLITACKNDITMDETSGSLISRKKRSSSSEREVMNNMYKDNGNTSINTEMALKSTEILQPEHTMTRKRSTHQNTEKKVTATNFSGSDELKTSNNSSCMESTARNITIEKKEYEETTIASVCKNVRNLQDNITFRLNAIPSTSSSTMDPNLEDTNNNNSTHFDYDHFDVAPNENLDVGDKRVDKWKRSKKNDGKFNNLDLYKTVSGYINPIFFSSDELENLNTVPVYTTKDGKITYSPNPKFTYRELIIEARAKDTYSNVCESSYFTTSSPLDYYNYSKLHKIFKRNRNIPTAIRKKEIDSDGRLQSTTKHVNHSLNKSIAHKNTHCVKIRNTPHLEFFNDDADKLYVNRNHQQDSKEDNKNIVDLNILEKQYNLDNESTSSTIKRCKTKVFADNFGYEKGYSENSMFDSNLFLGSKIAYWEETMESIKSYSSHIDRRNNDNLKELNFSEVFAAQKRLELFPFPSAQNSLNTNNNQKTNNNVTNELISNRAICIYNIDNRDQNAENDSSRNQLNAILLTEQDECNKQDISMTKANDYTSYIADEYPKQESQSNEIQSSMIMLTEQAHSSKVADTRNTKESQDSTNNIKDQEILTEHLIESDAHAHIKKDKSNIRNESTKQISDLNSTEITTLPESNATNLCNEPETTEKSVSTEKNDEVDSAKNNSDSERGVNEIACQQVSLVPIDCEAKEEAIFVTEATEATEANFDKTYEQNNIYNKENSITNKNKEPIILQNLSDVVFMEQLQFNKKDNEQQSQKLENKEEISKASSKNQVNNEVDDYNAEITPRPIASLDLLPISMEKNVCNLFMSEKCEQNISEFTVIKSIIADKKEYQDSETKNESKDCDNIIDTKLLCMDSSDYGIYAEDRCALTRMSEHDFTEEDSMVPMEWETSQIQEEAVNRLCNIDESSIDFAVAANSLQDSSLLNNLSLSTSLKESGMPETAVIIENKLNTSMPTTALPEIEVSKMTPINKENKEQASSSKHERMSYWRTTDCNANTKMVPKLVIKKSNIDNMIHKSLLKPGCQPKIPKMIIRNARSRPGTPSIESVHEEIPVQINISNRMSLTSEELYENDSQSSLQESNGYRNKIPKMKIKLDDKHSNKIIKTKDITELCVRRKNIKKTIPKVKIKNSSRIDLSDNSICDIISQGKNLEKYEEKIPILKLKKKERNRSSSPEASRKRQGSTYSETSSKKCKKSERDEMGHSIKRSHFSDSTRTVIPESETKKNSLIRISEKIPKVIIKRTSASAEFKCELSKECKDIIAKSAKWQPAVKLERYQVLDSMVKDLKLTLSSVSLRNINEMFTNRKDNCQEKKDDNKLSKSNSMSNLLPVKCKQRRMSDYDCRKVDYADNFICALSQNLSDSKMSTTPKKTSCKSYQNDNKYRSRSRDKNPQAETNIIPYDKEINQSLKKSSLEKTTLQHDDHKTTIRSFDTNHKQAVKDKIISNKLNQKSDSSKHSNNSTNFKIAVKELKTTSKLETCFMKSDLNEMPSIEISMRTTKKQIKEQHDNSFLNTDSKAIIKKEPLSDFSNDIDNNCNLQNDITLLKDATVLNDFEFDSNTVIKIESSDESQSTIEILPASPDSPNELESRIIEHRDSEQLYSADAIPTQFELELEITDNSNIDLLDVAMPKLDPVTNYSSRRVSTEESYSNQISKTERKFELSSHKNLLGKDKNIEIDISSNDKALPNNNNLISSAREVPLKYTCSEIDSTATKKNFCCNDFLIKEVLAAKETLKKCLSKSKYEKDSTKNNLRPKTAAEKKQGLSFDFKDLSEAHSKSSDDLQDCHNDVTFQKISITDKHNKIETTTNVEKFDQKHSRQNKNCFMKEKLNDKKNKEFHLKETMKDTREYTSPETFKQVNQVTLNKGPTRTICLSEKRKHSMDQDNHIFHLQNSQRKELSPYKIPKVSKSTDQESNVSSKTKDIKADNMPILEPEIAITFDANSDRDNSRSPPVITNQDSGSIDIESKLISEKIIISDNKIESDIKDVCKKSEISISDFISQLAYHEKATIKHRRYCNLCERWFPTTSRHRRHLAGYQHRHIELTQRRSIHALFMLFTGKPCPRLLPANITRNDCSMGELTPLQIAVQDVIKSFDHAQQSPRKQNDVDK